MAELRHDDGDRWQSIGDFPSDTTFIGAAIIVASGGFVFYREIVVKRPPQDG